MKILCWNINGLLPTLPNVNLKYKGLKGFFDSYGADIVCVQESKLPESKLTKETVCVDGYESFWAISREKQGYSGVTTWAKLDSSPVNAEVDCLGGGSDDIDREGRIIITDHGSFVLINVYVPNAGDAVVNATGEKARPRVGFKCRFLEALIDRMERLRAQGRKVIAVGDFNIAADKRDVHSSFNYDRMYCDEELRLMRGLIAQFPDVWRRRHPDADSCFTVWDEKTSARAFNAGCRIDYVLVSPELVDQVVSCEILTDIPPKWSDHAALLVEITGLDPPPPHPPCALSSRRMKKFYDPGQKTIAAMFGKKRAAPPEEAQPAAAPAALPPPSQAQQGEAGAGAVALPPPAAATDGSGAPATAAAAAAAAEPQEEKVEAAASKRPRLEPQQPLAAAGAVGTAAEGGAAAAAACGAPADAATAEGQAEGAQGTAPSTAPAQQENHEKHEQQQGGAPGSSPAAAAAAASSSHQQQQQQQQQQQGQAGRGGGRSGGRGRGDRGGGRGGRGAVAGKEGASSKPITSFFGKR